jgi:hypothetical protein
MCHTITSQLIGHDFPGFTAMTPQQALEKALCSSTISFHLEIYINNFTILIDSAP